MNPSHFPQLANQHRCQSGYTCWPGGRPFAVRRSTPYADTPLAPMPRCAEPAPATYRDTLLTELERIAYSGELLPTTRELADKLGWTTYDVQRALDRLVRYRQIERSIAGSRTDDPRSITILSTGQVLRNRAAAILAEAGPALGKMLAEAERP